MPSRLLLALLFLSIPGFSAARSHYVGFGAPFRVHLFLGPEADRVRDVRIRSLLVDGRTREFVIGDAHDVTDKIFVVRRTYRMNDSLNGRPEWKWQRGGWIMVDRTNGHITRLSLPDFDPFYSTVSWFRDYAAYCGVSDGQKLLAVVAQIGQRKPVLHSSLGAALNTDDPDGQCSAPLWQKTPVRVTFTPAGGQKQVFTIRGRSGELEQAEEPSESKDAEKQ